jgi:hypothetical protein
LSKEVYSVALTARQWALIEHGLASIDTPHGFGEAFEEEVRQIRAIVGGQPGVGHAMAGACVALNKGRELSNALVFRLGAETGADDIYEYNEAKWLSAFDAASDEDLIQFDAWLEETMEHTHAYHQAHERSVQRLETLRATDIYKSREARWTTKTLTK